MNHLRDVCPKRRARLKFGGQKTLAWAIKLSGADPFKEQKCQFFFAELMLTQQLQRLLVEEEALI